MKKNRGFTFIEMMIAIVIMGLMAATVVPAYRNKVEKARVTKACANLITLRKGQANYFIKNNSFYSGGVDATFCDLIGLSPIVFSGDFIYNTDSSGNCTATRMGGQNSGLTITLYEDGHWNAGGFPPDVWPSDLH